MPFAIEMLMVRSSIPISVESRLSEEKTREDLPSLRTFRPRKWIPDDEPSSMGAHFMES